MLWTWLLAIGSFFAAAAVALGAIGSHALKGRLEADQLAIFETAVRYQMYHALGILILALAALRIDSIWLNLAAAAFILGILLFSGSLYLFLGWYPKAVAATPIGGFALILGWVFLLIASLSSAYTSSH